MPYPSFSNYRNPTGKDRAWCYTTNPEIEWQYCAVPYCQWMVDATYKHLSIDRSCRYLETEKLFRAKIFLSPHADSHTDLSDSSVARFVVRALMRANTKMGSPLQKLGLHYKNAVGWRERKPCHWERRRMWNAGKQGNSTWQEQSKRCTQTTKLFQSLYK